MPAPVPVGLVEGLEGDIPGELDWGLAGDGFGLFCPDGLQFVDPGWFCAVVGFELGEVELAPGFPSFGFVPLPGVAVPAGGIAVLGHGVAVDGIPGVEVPGVEVPGVEVPGVEVPGVEVPGVAVPGCVVLGDAGSPGFGFCVPGVVGLGTLGVAVELPGVAVEPPGVAVD